LLLAPKGLLNFYVAISGSAQEATSKNFKENFSLAPEKKSEAATKRSELFIEILCGNPLACFA